MPYAGRKPVHFGIRTSHPDSMPKISQGFPRIALACAALVLAACGGGGRGGDDDPGSTRLNEESCTQAYFSKAPAEPLTGPDPLASAQWHLANNGQSGGTPGEDLNVAGAWQAVNGAGVRIAVVDSGIEVVHEDLQPNIVPGGSYNYRPGKHHGSAYPLPCASNNHGTAVAGIVAARGGNGIGVTGVAPAASMVALNPLATNLDADIAHALGFQRELNAIYANSWGSPDGGALFPSDSSFDNVIEAGLLQGRGGLGSIFVFPAGNGGTIARDTNGNIIRDNSNFDGYVNKRGQIAVCAVDDRGERPWYGETGANVLVCAPSSNLPANGAITTTGLNSGYISSFTGTSASSPMVSGTVALMLQANPSLTWRDVQLILASTARRNSPSSPGWTQNFGLWYHPDFGFGTVDAATTWQSVGGSTQQKRCDSPVRNPNLPIADNNEALAVSDSVTMVCDIQAIEFIEVRFTADHSYSGDLQIDLVSPNGLQSQLANARLCVDDPFVNQPTVIDCGRYDGWRFGSVRHLNEPASGTWTLRVADLQLGDSGVFQSWQIRIWGR
jgi:subtilisin-like proprotein convertase family protein